VKLYFAGSYGTGGSGERGLLLAGVHNRLVTYADTGPSSSQTRRFWIDGRTNERTDGRTNERTNDMKLYIAGNGKSPGSAQRDFATGARNRLLSYAFSDDWAKQEFEFWIQQRPDDVSVFLDSGAFSAYTLGRDIDLAKYCDYILEHREALAAYAVLDVIKDVAGTLANLGTMRARGLDPVPVFHVDRERTDLLEQYLRECDYVALGGMAADRPTREELQGKLDPCWKVVERYWPKRIHGLGVMAPWALERYPFYSTDSSSAILAAGMGRVTRYLHGNVPSRGMGRQGGQLLSDGWKDDVRRTLDGDVADGIGRIAASGKSNSAHEGRRVRNIQAQLAFERYITELWTRKGVTWDT
jgi:hypothetical protein